MNKMNKTNKTNNTNRINTILKSKNCVIERKNKCIQIYKLEENNTKTLPIFKLEYLHILINTEIQKVRMTRNLLKVSRLLLKKQR